MIRLPAVLDNTDSKTKANNDNIQTTSLADTTTSTSLPVVTIESEYREVHVCLPESTACGRARMDRYSFNRNKNNIPIKYISGRYDYFSWPMSLQNSDANANDKFMHHSDHNHLLDRWHDGTERKTRQAITHVSIFVKKGSPYSITQRRVPELIPVLGSQPAGDVNHKPDGRLQITSRQARSYPPQPLRRLLPILLPGEQKHNGCEQFA